jgi:glutamate/tyrosine decarboxylase-like PLP-dependent enzyme
MANEHSVHAATLQLAAHSAIDFLASLETRSAAASADADSLRSRLGGKLSATPKSPIDVIEELVREVEPGLVASAGGRFFAWVIGGTLPAALAADWLTSAWDQNAAIYATSPAAAAVEEIAGAWLKELLAIPASAGFAFVTGCQMAHVTCLAAARHALAARAGWDIEERGLNGGPPIRVVSSENRHHSIDRALRLLGLGTNSLRFIATNDEETLSPRGLEDALLAESETPAIVLLQAGDINTGAFDDFAQLIPIAKRHNAWVHIDGAFGLWAAASPRYRHLLAGADAADSWATDGHKWLNVPFDAGYAFVADPLGQRAAMSIRAPYIASHLDARDQIDWNPEWSRRARGFPTYAALRELGSDGLATLIDRTCEHAKTLVGELSRLDGVDVLWRPIINQGLVRFGDDRTTEAVIERVAASGEAFFGPTTWRGVRAMRVSVLSWQTTERDISRAVDAIRAALALR